MYLFIFTCRYGHHEYSLIPDEMNFMFAEIIVEENRCSCVSLTADVAVGADLAKAGTFSGSFTYQTLDGAAVWPCRSLPQNCRNY